MTIYSQHPNRGKIQILATYRQSAGVTSSTVTSVTESAVAARLVDALNRVSALMTAPVSVHDQRGDRIDYYPRGHLSALTDQNSRDSLLDGSHSLWYELVKALLHRALADLDVVASSAPAPVRTAIGAELEAEEASLRAALDEFSEGISMPESDGCREWEFESPFVTFDGLNDALSNETRQSLNDLEEGVTAEQLRHAVTDLRVLIDAYSKLSDHQAHFEIPDLSIFADQYDSYGYYLSVDAPRPSDTSDSFWRIDIGRWEPTGPEGEESAASGESVLQCICMERPTASEVADLLNLITAEPDQLAAWAETSVAEKLAGTNFTVTERTQTARQSA